MSSAYDNNNVFAKILRGEIPCYKVYEDDVALAFMDIMPRIDGHTLVIPKFPARTLLDADPDKLGELIKRVQKVAAAVKNSLGAEGLTLLQSNESAGGQVIFHLHFHILPRWEGIELKPSASAMEAPEVLEKFQTKIATALK
ncbi:MAG: HIT family protein [Methylovirgula sp.]|uniref:HIT family protein n=1 Tax=Methylovirgula sp. TaxID=1978224 RepID=UPI0030761195